MSTQIDQFLAEVPITKIPGILGDYEEYRRNGCIGECDLRFYTEAYVKQNDIKDSVTALWLDRMGMEAYRFAALVLMGKAKGIILPDSKPQ